MKKGLSNEYPYYICPYPADEEFEAVAVLKRVIAKLSAAGIKSLKLNIYRCIIDCLKAQNVFDAVLQAEETMNAAEFESVLKNAVNIEQVLMPFIKEKIDAQNDISVIFISGVGNAFPIVRVHTILNYLPAIVTDIPVLVFFPGDYVASDNLGSSLELFGIFKDDRYYRAKDIRELEA